MADLQPAQVVRVGLLACAADDRVAAEVRDQLADKGLQVVLADELTRNEDLGVVVLISSDSVHDPAWQAAIQRVQGARLVPVKLDDLPAELVPTPLRPLSWILWHDDERALMGAKLFTAVQSDVRRYRIARGLASMADVWQRSGRRDEDLVLDVRAARAASDTLRQEALVGSVAAQRNVADFVTRSVRRAVRYRWRRRFRWARRSALAVIVGVIAVVVVVTGRQLVAANRLEFSVGDLYEDNRPDLQAIKLSGELLNGLALHAAHPVAFRQLATKLSQQWTSAVIGVANDSSVNDIALSSDRRQVITADGRGTVSWWDARSGNVVRRFGYGVGPLYSIAATDDASTIAVSNDRQVIVLNGVGQRLHTLAADSAGGIALTGDGRTLVLVSAAGQLTTVAADSSAAPHRTGITGEVLALRRVSSGHVVAVLDLGANLELVDAVSGARIARSSWSRPVYPVAAIGRDASVVVNEGDGQLWWAQHELRLRPTGQHVPDILTALSVASSHMVVVASDTYGTSILDPLDGLYLGRVCTEFSRVLSIRVSPDGQTVSCNGRGLVDLNDVSDRPPIGPATRQGATRYPVQTTSTSGTISSVSARADGIVAIAVRNGRTIDLDPASTLFSTTTAGSQHAILAPGQLHYSGLATAVAVKTGGSTLAVGSSDGVVTEIDVRASGDFSMVGRWQLPDGAAVQRLRWDLAGHLDADTDAFRWQERSCAGCFIDWTKALDAVAARRWACYTSSTANLVRAPIRRLLDLKVCADVPAPGSR